MVGDGPADEVAHPPARGQVGIGWSTCGCGGCRCFCSAALGAESEKLCHAQVQRDLARTSPKITGHEFFIRCGIWIEQSVRGLDDTGFIRVSGEAGASVKQGSTVEIVTGGDV